MIGIDALITNVPGYCVCVTTADCVPVLLYDKKLQVVAAIHAGWKGTVKHIVSNVLEHMNQKFGTQGEDVIACIGPSISLASLKWVMRCTKLLKKVASICLLFLLKREKPESIILICGKQIGLNY